MREGMCRSVFALTRTSGSVRRLRRHRGGQAAPIAARSRGPHFEIAVLWPYDERANSGRSVFMLQSAPGPALWAGAEVC